MITRQKVKKRLFIMLFLSLVFFLCASLISFSSKKFFTPHMVTERLTREIASSLTDLETELSKVAKQNIEDGSGFILFLDNNYKNTFSEKGIEILVYTNDTLKFWTSNAFAAPFINNRLNFKPEIVYNGSGYYLIKRQRVRNHLLVALQLIKYNYKYSNEYLPSGFFKRFKAPTNAIVDLKWGEYNIKAPSGEFLFSLNYEQPVELAVWLQYVIFTLYITSFLCLISSLFFIYTFLIYDLGKKGLLFLAFIFDVIILRAIQFYFRFPFELYDLQLFSPAFYASSALLPSLGDFLINAVLGVQLAFLAYNRSTFLEKISPKPASRFKIVVPLIILLILVILYRLLTDIITGLVLNSSISFRLENILSLTHISHAGLFIVALLLLGFLFLFELSGKYLLKYKISPRLYLLVSLIVFVCYIGFSLLTRRFDYIITLFLLSLLVIIFLHKQGLVLSTSSHGRVISVVIVLSAMATYSLNKAETTREYDKRRLLAAHLSDARDNLVEYYYREASKNIQKDETLKMHLSDAKSDSALSMVASFIKDKYFSGYWSKYVIQITVCNPEKNLSIKPANIIINCEKYFDEKIEQFMQPVSVPGLYFLRESADALYYLGKIVIGSGDSVSMKRDNIFIEISSNDIWKGLGYPELLYDSKNVKSDNLFGYSYAYYYKGELIKNVGKFSYEIDSRNIINHKAENGIYNSLGYSHLIFNADANTMIVLSKEVPGLSEMISPFSYIFLVLIIMLLFINWMKGSSLSFKVGIYSFRLRLQVIMISTIVISSIILVTVSLLFINKLNSNKNNEILNEKLNSVLVDLETRYGNYSTFDSVSSMELSDLLLNLSNTYFTDINIYNSSGFLLASSRDQIFREGMISEQINAHAARQLMIEKKSFFIERENIGSYSFLSAYTPVRNIDNQLLGYLNLPYFARQEEIRREISGLVSAFANIYIIMIAITVMLALLLSRYITKPLQQIGNQFSRVKIGNKNAKIEWKRKDEIGRLVDEYNRMIDEMEKSAELLARSERESAWRQMARQVAHEIKNPLTPIKLSMQLLMRAWNDKAPDWEVRLKRFSQTLIMQIDTLSAIATEFSDFAQMPESRMEQFDIIPLIQQSASLYRDQSDCEIIFETDLTECVIMADPNQILRVFNNLIKNALQAIPGDRQGKLLIRLVIINNTCEISFQDNGIGIANDRQTRIFSPNFTTKTAGMGLGLAMVKNIIENSNGRIWFETNPGIGTTFFVSLPLKD